MTNHLIKKLVIIAILIHSILLGYFLLFIQFFQQDEWHGFGIILSYGTKYITLGKSTIELLLGDRVGARMITFSLFKLFELNSLPYGVFAFIFHLINTFFVYVVAKRLTKDPTISILASFLFLINELGNEAYSWFGTMSGSVTSVLFFLISFIFFIKFINTEKIKFIFFSTFFLWISFLFKEVGVFAFIFYPLLFLLMKSSNKIKIREILNKYSSLIILGAIMTVFFVKTVIFIPGDRANYIQTGKSLIPSILIHSIQYPLEGLIQTIIPNDYLFKLSNKLTKVINPNLPKDSLDFLIASQNQNSEITIVLLLIFFLIIMFLFLRKLKLTPDSLKTLKISLAMTLLSFFPYVVINRSFSYLDSRYYYMGTVGISIFISTLIFNLFKVKNILFKISALLIIVLYIFIHESTLLSDFQLMADRSKERQMFLSQINSLVPNVQNNMIFFVTGDSQGYYGLPELKVPFQSGLGHVLMVKFATEGKINSIFFQENSLTKALDVGFLYDILGQGYRKINNQGFGYYYDKLELEKALNQKLFDKKDVISLYYQQENMKIIKSESIK